MKIKSAVATLCFFLLIPFAATASSGQKDFAFLWSSPIWSMSSMALILLWIALLIISSSDKKRRSDDTSPLSSRPREVPSSTLDAPQSISYTVKRGDSLVSIAKQFGTTRDQIIASNHMQPPFKMKLGQLIHVPAPMASAQAKPTIARTTVDNIQPRVTETALPWSVEESASSRMDTFRKPQFGHWAVWLKALVAFVTVAIVFLFGVLIWVQKNDDSLNELSVANNQPETGDVGIAQEAPLDPSPISNDMATSTATASSEINNAPEPKTTPLSIMNGSGIRGAAGKLAELMRTEKFEILDTGNADRFDYAATEVRYSSDFSLWAEVVAGWLRLKGYDPVLLERSGLDHIVIVIGKK